MNYWLNKRAHRFRQVPRASCARAPFLLGRIEQKLRGDAPDARNYVLAQPLLDEIPMGFGVTSAHRKRQDYVDLGGKLGSVSLSKLPASDRKLIESDPVLKTMVHGTTDRVIRGEDFGKIFDRLETLDRQAPRGGATTLTRADAMFDAVKGSKAPATTATSSADARTRMGIFGATTAHAEKKAGDARSFAAEGEQFAKAGDELAAKGDKAGAEAMYKKSGDAYANAVARMNTQPSLATLEHWDANSVADWGLAGIESYQKAGLSIQRNGDARTIGNMDVNKVETGIARSYGFDRGLDLGNRWMRFGDALAKTDKPAALEAYKNAKGQFDDSIRMDKKFYPVGLDKHVIPSERAALKIETMEANIARDKNTVFPATDYRAHLLTADQAKTAFDKADASFDALNARKPPMPDSLRAAVKREAADAIAAEMKVREKNSTPAERAEFAAKAADYFSSLGDPVREKEAHAMAARANLELAAKATDARTKGALYATAARQMTLAQKFTQPEIEKAHGNAAAAFQRAALTEKTPERKGELLEKAGDEFRAAKKEKEAVAAYHESAKAYLSGVGEKPSLLSSKTATIVTAKDLQKGGTDTGDFVAEGLGKAALAYEKAGQPADRAAAEVLRTRSEAYHNVGLREKFKDPIFAPPVELENGEISPKSIRDFENNILKKHGGDFKKAAAEFDALAAKPGAGDTQSYFQMAADRMRMLQTMKEAGVTNLQNPPTRANLTDFAKIRGEQLRAQRDANGLALTEPEVAQRVATELQTVTDPFYVHRSQIGKDIDYQANAKNSITVDPDGRMHGDCEVYAYDIAMAMEGAGFKASSETRAPNDGGPSHVIVSLQDKSGAFAGALSNNQYYRSTDSAFASVGMPAGSEKDKTIRARAEDPRAK